MDNNLSGDRSGLCANQKKGYQMKLLYFLILLLFMTMQPSLAQTQANNGAKPLELYKYLKAEGKACHLFFTVEDFYDPNSGRSLLHADIADKEITSSDNLISYLRQQLPDATVSIRYKRVVSIIKTSLLSNKNYALNRSVACDYDGTNYDLTTYLSPLVDNKLCIDNTIIFGRIHLPYNLHLSIHSKNETIRSIYTAHLPLDNISPLLWNARTVNRSGKEITYFQPAGIVTE